MQSSDTSALVAILTCSLGVVFFGFVPYIVGTAGLELAHAWRISAGLLAIYHSWVIWTASGAGDDYLLSAKG